MNCDSLTKTLTAGDKVKLMNELIHILGLIAQVLLYWGVSVQLYLTSFPQTLKTQQMTVELSWTGSFSSAGGRQRLICFHRSIYNKSSFDSFIFVSRLRGKSGERLFHCTGEVIKVKFMFSCDAESPLNIIDPSQCTSHLCWKMNYIKVKSPWQDLKRYKYL